MWYKLTFAVWRKRESLSLYWKTRANSNDVNTNVISAPISISHDIFDAEIQIPET